MPVPLLQASGLSCERDDRLLFVDLELAVAPGDLLQIEGPNGSGKTTLLRMLAGLHTGFEGEIRWCGEPLARQREHFLRNLLYIGHRPGIKPLLTPLENLRAQLSGKPGVGDEQLESALDAVALFPFIHVPCHHLSAGQQRRVALAALYLSDEPLWILDEAFTAIDKDGVASLERLLHKRMSAGGAVILTTHHPLHVDGARSLSLARFAPAAEDLF
ncbi:cytochrome c biogenesis heme-transporting ATPase CcmA [Marinobacter sp. BGYM27]|uniref:cytochrome c biogenesis heme-transporting ATPase CcmA n=1 Tax=Marinobacter sp. BGYM27 TaxID=2975597 RepID=UPI0021A66FFE|nr:cytochrome c biogenesis heme-transporting ATPase CcmA [Marinobacter sp. BGYM27]MDG5498623.1 cytochrome c biogenesis heme-transporting ATPase CcmA [Marinobacter sp. BGYM27]